MIKMITMSTYKKLSYNFKKQFVVKKGIRYHISTITGEVVEDGPVAIYDIKQVEDKMIRKQIKNTTKNYTCSEMFLSGLDNQCTTNYNICEGIKKAPTLKSDVSGIYDFKCGEKVNIKRLEKNLRIATRLQLKPKYTKKFMNSLSEQ